ncbi:MAG: 16S rRNA (guanine(966)-N(2))-methyltransferase RsmD [Chlamydiales bacterium]
MSLRIIGGEMRGRPLKSPRSALIRPTTGILRKSVFDICKEQIVDAQFLDLFAGTGAMGIEALSRGAAHATFVDQDKEALLCIRENLKRLKLEERATILRGDALELLKRLEERQKKYDLIYIDPPYYEKHFHPEILALLDHMDLARGATIFVEEGIPSPWEKEKIPLEHFALKNSRRFGRSVLYQYRAVA